MTGINEPIQATAEEIQRLKDGWDSEFGSHTATMGQLNAALTEIRRLEEKIDTMMDALKAIQKASDGIAKYGPTPTWTGSMADALSLVPTIITEVKGK